MLAGVKILNKAVAKGTTSEGIGFLSDGPGAFHDDGERSSKNPLCNVQTAGPVSARRLVNHSSELIHQIYQRERTKVREFAMRGEIPGVINPLCKRN